MTLRTPCLLLLSFGFIISAVLPLGSPPRLSAKSNLAERADPSNILTLSPDTSLENSFEIHCNSSLYGLNPNIRDCENAKESMTPDSSLWSLGERNTGLPVGTVPLPYRVMGGRALCYVQPVLIGDHKTALASLNMIRSAASALVMQCATGTESQGGIATNIGKSEEEEECQCRYVAKKTLVATKRCTLTVSRIPLGYLTDTRRWRQQSSRHTRNI